MNSPPATMSPFGRVVRASTALDDEVPEPKADQLVPFHRARRPLAPPTVLNMPPATRSPFGGVVRAATKVNVDDHLTPVPSAAQLVPFHRAMLLALVPPAVLNEPHATRSPFGRVVSACTPSWLKKGSPLTPEPSADKTPDAG